MIEKSEQQEIDRAGKRLLREVLEPLKWVVNNVEEDFGIDSNVQVFLEKSPTGTWFHVQLKSSASSSYSADRSFISQELSIDHARHYALEMREPVILVHCDTSAKTVYWHAPQLDNRLIAVLAKTGARFVTLRIPRCQQLPQTASDLLTNLDRIYLVLASRELTAATNQQFSESIKHLPDQRKLHQAYQERNDILKLRKIVQLYKERKLDEAQPRAEVILSDPDSSVEIKFWAQIQLEGIEFTRTVHEGKPQSALPQVAVKHARALRRLAASGPNYLKFYALIARAAAELDVLVQENLSLFMAIRQHLEELGNPMTALGLYARKAAVTERIISKYNDCLRLVQAATNYPDRWMLGRAMVRIAQVIGKYITTVGREENFEAQDALAQSALQICKVAAWVCEETGDAEGVVVTILSALMTTRSTDSEAYRWATSTAERLSDAEVKVEARGAIDRAERRWKGETLEGDYQGDTIWQIIQNMAFGLGIDVTDEDNPLVKMLRIAAKDNSPERVLVTCEHILDSLGATGPIALEIQQLFNISTAGSKLIHCTLHSYHVEGKDLDSAYTEFKKRHCDSCPDRNPRPKGWGTGDDIRQLRLKHSDFVKDLNATPNGFRYAKED